MYVSIRASAVRVEEHVRRRRRRAVATASIFSRIGALSSYRKLEVVRLLAGVDDRRREVGRAGAAAGEPVVDLGGERARLDARRAGRSSTSSSVSPGRRLTATTAGIPNSRMIPRWRRTFAMPVSSARIAWARPTRGSSSTPPWCLIARTVVTSTTALGLSPPNRQTMSKNFSIPMSDPKPDSVTT